MGSKRKIIFKRTTDKYPSTRVFQIPPFAMYPDFVCFISITPLMIGAEIFNFFPCKLNFVRKCGKKLVSPILGSKEIYLAMCCPLKPQKLQIVCTTNLLDRLGDSIINNLFLKVSKNEYFWSKFSTVTKEDIINTK